MKRLATTLLGIALIAAFACAKVNVPKNDKVLRPTAKVTKTTIIDFTASWCAPCLRFAPAFEKAAKNLSGQLNFIKVDIDRFPKTAKAFGVKAVPTIYFLYPGGGTFFMEGTDAVMYDGEDTETFTHFLREHCLGGRGNE